jgi:hypothetical protein
LEASPNAGVVDIFGANGGRNLNGGRPIPRPAKSTGRTAFRSIRPLKPVRREIDTKLSIRSAASRVGCSAPGPVEHLTIRNTLRGKHVGLPRGQQVAKAMRVNVLSNVTLRLSSDSGWGGEAPLWYYILKEAELDPYKDERLEPVCGRIMAETPVGLL